ncbi:hypothetical protein STEG23_035621 [Scotinomys teguina]
MEITEEFQRSSDQGEPWDIQWRDRTCNNGLAVEYKKRQHASVPDKVTKEIAQAPPVVDGGGSCCSEVPAASHRVDGSDAVTADESFATACSENSHQDHRVTRKHRQRTSIIFKFSYASTVLE